VHVEARIYDCGTFSVSGDTTKNISWFSALQGNLGNNLALYSK
jgi:hypothetical protein